MDGEHSGHSGHDDGSHAGGGATVNNGLPLERLRAQREGQ
jgi:hypothetical protein